MKVIINGSGGYMGKVLSSVCEKNGAEVVFKVDKFSKEADSDSLFDFSGKADVVIDFSHHSAAKELCDYAVKAQTPLVIATTGHTEEELAYIEKASKEIPLFHAANMSLGVALLADLAKKAALVLENADIEIVEVHHNRKIDAPSGTAKMIAKEIQSVLPEKQLVCGREGMKKREKNEIGIHSLRMGNVVGVHEVHLCTESQCITLRHEAEDRGLFAEGALSAAKFLINKEKGFYTMKDLLS